MKWFKKRSAIEYVESGEHLPDFLVDFHDQKRVFKFIGESVEIRKNEALEHYIESELPNWVISQIYVIDFFLWVMAKFGYTLQKSRARVQFYDLDGSLKAFEEQELKKMADELNGLSIFG